MLLLGGGGRETHKVKAWSSDTAWLLQLQALEDEGKERRLRGGGLDFCEHLGHWRST